MVTRLRRTMVKPPENTTVRRITRRRLGAPEPAPARRADADGKIVELDEDSPLVEYLKRVRSTPRAMRGGDYLHVSDLIHRCLRKSALCEKYNVKPRPQVLTLGDRFTFAQGEAIHDTAKQMFVESAPNEIWGRWRCHCGFLHHEEPCTLEETDVDEVCPQCRKKCNIYEEVPMFDDELMVAGNPDLLHYRQAIQAFHVSELKSISHDQWKDLKRPLPDHVLQAIFYWRIMHRRGYPLTDHVSILYVTKGWVFGYTSPVKEFVLKVAPELPRLNDMIEDAIAYRDAKKSGRLPIRIKCSTTESPDAKNCEVCQLCFQER